MKPPYTWLVWVAAGLMVAALFVALTGDSFSDSDIEAHCDRVADTFDGELLVFNLCTRSAERASQAGCDYSYWRDNTLAIMRGDSLAC